MPIKHLVFLGPGSPEMKRKKIKYLLLSWVPWRKMIHIWSRQIWLWLAQCIVTNMFSYRGDSFSFMHDLKPARGTVFTQEAIFWITGQMVDHVSIAVLRCNVIAFFSPSCQKIHSIEKYTSSFILKNGQL